MLRAGVAAAALPAATTYARIWTPPKKLVWRSNMLGIKAQLDACNSIALEVLPFQDELSHWLSVYIATAKANVLRRHSELEIVAGRVSPFFK